MLNAMKRLWGRWKGLAHGLVAIQNGVLVALVFVFGLGPGALLAWLTRHKLLDRAPRGDEEPETHWRELKPGIPGMDGARRQF